MHFASVRADDILYTKTGEEYPGTLKRITADRVVFVTRHGIRSFAREAVSSIDFSRKRTGDSWKNVKDITDPFLKNLLANAPSDTDYPSSNYVTPFLGWEIVVQPDSTIEKVHRTVRIVFTEPGKDVANTGVSYNSRIETARLDFGRGVTPDGRVTSIRDAAIDDISVHPSPAPFDRLHQLKIALPEAQLGSVLDYQATISGKKFDDTNPFYVDVTFGDDEPILDCRVRVALPPETELCWWARDVGAPAVTDSAGKRIYTWRVANTPPLLDETDRPPRAELLPRLVAAVKADWRDLGRNYQRAVEDSLAGADGLKPLVDSIARGGSDRNGLISALYNFVAKTIRYIPIGMDEFSLVPHSIGTIFGRRFGNGLDKSFLLYGLLRQAGIPAALVLVPSRDKGPLVEAVPSLGQFDRALVAVDDTLFLEPNTDRIPAGILTGDVQGVSGLVAGSGRIVTTPVAPAPAEGVVLETVCRIDEKGDLDARALLRLSGNEAVRWREYKERTQAEIWVSLNQFVTGIHPQARLVDYRFSDLADLSKPVRLEFRYHVSGFGLVAGRFMLFTLPGVQYSAWEVGNAERQYPLSFDRLSLVSHNLTIEFPWSYTLYHLPGGSHVGSRAVGYNSIFRVYHHQILFEDYLERDARTIPVEIYADYRQTLETAASQSLGMVVLKKVGG